MKARKGTEFQGLFQVPDRGLNQRPGRILHEQRGFTSNPGGVVFHETHHYNAQVRMADVDGDSLITDAEASAYRERMNQNRED